MLTTTVVGLRICNELAYDLNPEGSRVALYTEFAGVVLPDAASYGSSSTKIFSFDLAPILYPSRVTAGRFFGSVIPDPA